MVNACCIINCQNRSHGRRGKRIASNGVRFVSFPAWKQNNGIRVADCEAVNVILSHEASNGMGSNSQTIKNYFQQHFPVTCLCVHAIFTQVGSSQNTFYCVVTASSAYRVGVAKQKVDLERFIISELI